MSYSLFAHQQTAKDRALPFDSYGLFMDTGTGKSLTTIELVKERWKYFTPGDFYDGPAYRVLIICPLQVIEKVWRPEFKKFAPQFSLCNLWRVLKKKKPISQADIYAINFESLSRLPADFLRGVHFLILDESSKIKNNRAKITKFILGLSERIRYRLALSGSPAPNSPLEYWAQMYFVNPEVLGHNFYAFRKRNFYSYGFGGYQWAPKQRFLDILPELLSKQSYSIKKSECLDLPEQTFQFRSYEMEGDQLRVYKELVKESVAIFRNHAVLGVNELAKIMKLRQVTSGFFSGQDGKIIELTDVKFKILKDTLEEIGNHQVIIWCQFHWEIDKIKALLGDKCVTLYGKMSQKDKEEAIEKFTDGTVQYLIGHPKTGGHGLNFTNASYVVYFSLSYSYEEQKQSQDRCHRIGQRNNVTYIYLLAEKSVDGRIYKALQGKEKMSDAILSMIKEYEYHAPLED